MAIKGRGGKRPGAGRKKGSRNKVTADIKRIAQDYGEESILAMVEIMRDKGAPHASRVAAAREVLDRGYGKSVQTNDLTSSDGSMSPKSLSEFYAEQCANSESGA